MSTLTPGELEVYQACSEGDGGMLRQKELEKRITVKGADMAAAVNGLLKKSLLKIMKDEKGVLSYKAVDKADAKVVGLMDADESIVYKKIQEAKNEGIWTKHLKSTELHQSVITRVLKSLEKKGLIKSIKSVKHPTRKIYILANLQPSVEVSGGPWYNNSEFETEFVQTLCNACLNFIQKRSYPMQKSNSKLSPRAIFPTSQSSRYPTAADVLNFLKQTNITDTPLDIAHVESLLQVLVYDGTVEALPGSGFGGLPFLDGSDDEGSEDEDSDSDDAARRKKKRKKEKEKASASSSSKKGKKRARNDDSDSASDNNNNTGSDSDATAGRKKKRRKKAKDASDSDESGSGSGEEDDSDSESNGRSRKRKKGKSSSSKSKSRSKSRSKSKSRRNASGSDSESESGSGSDSDEDASGSESDRGRRKSKSKKTSGKAKSKSKSKSSKSNPEPSVVEVQFDANAGRVYRAVRPERVALGWSQSPCGACPQFDFCHDSGPVNARECQYYSTWLNAGVADAE